MDSNKPWDKAKLSEWKKFWESEMGVEALKKMETLKNNCIEQAMGTASNEAIAGFVARAAGIELVMQDILTGIQIADKELEKEGRKKKQA